MLYHTGGKQTMPPQPESWPGFAPRRAGTTWGDSGQEARDMPSFLDHPLIVPLGLGVLALNAASLLALLVLRPAARQRHERRRAGAFCRGLLGEALGTFALV